MAWLWILCGSLLMIAALLIKIALLRKAAAEIYTELAERLKEDTNALISISSADPYMRRLASELNVQLRLLRDERRRFQSGDLELRDAVTNVSHDLRTPLTAICGYLDLLRREEKSENAARYISVIENRVEALKQLTDELFHYSVFTSLSGGNYETVDLRSVLEESVCAYYGALKGAGIRPLISMPEQAVQRRLDRKALSRVFENVLSNAVKYSDGDLTITLSESGEAVFSNHASQLDELRVGKLFDRFYTVADAKASTGLGLSIARALTEQMGGGIYARYREGVVSIHISFPPPEA